MTENILLMAVISFFYNIILNNQWHFKQIHKMKIYWNCAEVIFYRCWKVDKQRDGQLIITIAHLAIDQINDLWSVDASWRVMQLIVWSVWPTFFTWLTQVKFALRSRSGIVHDINQWSLISVQVLRNNIASTDNFAHRLKPTYFNIK